MQTHDTRMRFGLESSFSCRLHPTLRVSKKAQDCPKMKVPVTT